MPILKYSHSKLWNNGGLIPSESFIYCFALSLLTNTLGGEYVGMTRKQRICPDGKSVNYFWAVMKDAQFFK
jgi:hypothetical protein